MTKTIEWWAKGSFRRSWIGGVFHIPKNELISHGCEINYFTSEVRLSFYIEKTRCLSLLNLNFAISYASFVSVCAEYFFYLSNSLWSPSSFANRIKQFRYDSLSISSVIYDCAYASASGRVVRSNWEPGQGEAHCCVFYGSFFICYWLIFHGQVAWWDVFMCVYVCASVS